MLRFHFFIHACRALGHKSEHESLLLKSLISRMRLAILRKTMQKKLPLSMCADSLHYKKRWVYCNWSVCVTLYFAGVYHYVESTYLNRWNMIMKQLVVSLSLG